MSDPEKAPHDYRANDELIRQLTGMMPDERATIPTTEQYQLVERVKMGDSDAMQALVSQRLRWIYGYTQNQAELQQRYDLEIHDVMQIGVLAVIEAARAIDLVGGPDAVRARLHIAIPAKLGESLTRSKLVPSISQSNNTSVYSVSAKGSHARIVDSARPVEDAALRVLQHKSKHQQIDDAQMRAQQIYNDRIQKLLETLPERERQVIIMRYGIGLERPRLLREVSVELTKIPGQQRVTKQAILKVEAAALQRLQDHPTVKDDPHSGLDVDHTNYGLDSLTTPSALRRRRALADKKAEDDAKIKEKLEKQEAWLAEIETRQHLGDVVFVKGDLLKVPLSPELQEFLSTYDPNAKGANPARDLRRILE